MIRLLQRFAILAYLICEGNKKWGKVGHTYIQKLVYLLQEGLKVNLGYRFKMHYYGPYSEELWASLTSMEGMKLISIKVAPTTYGYNIYISPLDKAYKFAEEVEVKDKDKDFEGIKRQASKLISLFEGKSTRDLELLGTCHFVYQILKKRGKEADASSVAKVVLNLKPHFNEEQVKDALKLLKERELLN